MPARIPPIAGGTLFERMRRTTDMPVVEVDDVPRFLRDPTSGSRDLVVVENPTPPTDGTVRFTRGEVDGQPAVVMQERGDDDGIWNDSWSLPTDSVDAREGMIGWLNGQSHRWSRFATMLHRRGPDELTHWIFELMVVPSTSHATPPRYQPQGWTTIHQYAAPSPRRSGRAMVDDCACRPGSVQSTRDF